MIELPVKNRQGEQVGTVAIDEADFGRTVRHEVIREAILMYEKARRVGTVATKTRRQVKCSGAKPWRQKGTGRARAGSRSSPIWRGGGVAFGPHPRQFTNTMPRKALRAARRSAFLAKFQGATTVIDELAVAEPRTREVAAALKALDIDRSCLIAIDSYNPTLWKSARNIPGVSMKPVDEINAYDLLRHHRLLITRAALDRLVESLRQARPQPADAASEPTPAAEQAETSE